MRFSLVSLTVTCALLLGVPLPRSHTTVVGAGLLVQPAAGAFGGATDRTFSADGVTLRYREVGTGDPVVLIHGYSAALESQTGLANVLASTNRVVALDVRGFGQSSKFAEPARFGQSLVEDVVRLMDHLQITRAHLVGHSMGALIAANVVARHPARVASATLIAGPFYRDRPTFTKESGRWVDELEGGKGLTSFLQWLFPKMEPVMASAMSAQAMKANDLPSLIAVMRTLPELALAGLPSKTVPLVVAVGTGDPLHPLSVEFARSSPGATLLELEGVDHVAIVGRPEVMRAMRAVIGGKPGTAAVVHELRAGTIAATTYGS